MSEDGFKAAKRKVLDALLNGRFLHETDRSMIVTKNLLFTGDVTAEEVADVIKLSQGQDHSVSSHHQDGSCLVHVIKRDGWYLKFYFLDPDTTFISVHQ